MATGRANSDWEGELGLYDGSNSGIYTDFTGPTFSVMKEWGNAHLHMYYGGGDGFSNAAARLKFVLNEHITFAVTESYWHGPDMLNPIEVAFLPSDVDLPPEDLLPARDNYMSTTGAYLAVNVTPDIALKGLYYYQKQGDAWLVDSAINPVNPDNTATAWKVALDIKQEALKFTSLWVEYAQIDNHFWHNGALENAVPYAFNGASLLSNQPLGFSTDTTSVYGIVLRQQWNDKWRTYAGFYKADYGADDLLGLGVGLSDATNWAVGVGYRYNANVDFELSYDHIDYGDTNPAALGFRNGSDKQIRLRTSITF
jgi:hypothetical protein